MDAVSEGELIIVSSDSEFCKWVDVNVTDVDFALMIINKINLRFIISNLSLINLQV